MHAVNLPLKVVSKNGLVTGKKYEYKTKIGKGKLFFRYLLLSIWLGVYLFVFWKLSMYLHACQLGW